MNFLQKIRNGLRKTRDKLVGDLQRIVSRKKIDAETLDELETALISADFGVEMAAKIVEGVKKSAQKSETVDIFAIAADEIQRVFSQFSAEIRRADGEKPVVILLVGVNGTGKTTTAAKLAHDLKRENFAVLLAACDTFRAAAIDQLKIWGERVGCDVIAGQHGADASAVAFDALQAAKSRGADFLIVDTAGRQHTKKHLMEEMKKLKRTLQKLSPTAPHEILLVVDGTTGMNALAQAREFHDALGVTGLIVTKLDGTAKGGIVVAIANELKIPVKFVGLGEQADDLQPFDPKTFAEALFGQNLA
jgi:fused signal recognition particle receptor